LLLSLLLIVVLFFGLFNLRPQGLAERVVERFYILPLLLLVVFGAVGLDVLWPRLPRISAYARPMLAGVGCILALTHVRTASWAADQAVEDYLLNALDTVAPGSVIIGAGDMQVFGFLTIEHLYAYRTDVTYVDVHLLRYSWYHEQMRLRLPDLDLPHDPLRTRVSMLVADLLEEHSVYIADLGRPLPLEIQRQTYPIGPLLAVVPDGYAPPPITHVDRMNVALFNRLRFRTTAPVTPNSWSALALSYYARTWRALAKTYEDGGNAVRGRQLRVLAEQYGSGRPGRWNEGQVRGSPAFGP
jgi:hypothetical protein